MDDFRLKDISIKNFRSIKDVKFELSPEITLLVGPNGAGKSNILKAIAVLYNRVTVDKSDSSILFVGPSSIEGNTKSTKLYYNSQGQINYQALDSLTKAIFPDPQQVKRQAFYMSDSRLYTNQSIINTDPILMLPNGSDLSGAYNYYRGSKAEPNDIEDYLKKVQRIIPDINSIVAPNIKNNAGYAALKIKIGHGATITEISCDTATPGTLDAIFIAFVLQIFPHFSVYILDSPDINLHDGAQEALIKLIREIAKAESKQFIIATHSPVLINACSPDEVILVTKENAQTNVKTVSKVSEIIDVLQSTDTKLSDIASSMKAV